MSSFKPLTSPIFIITATRHDQTGFYEKSPLGTSLVKCYLDNPDIRVLVALENSAGLPLVYNAAIMAEGVPNDAILLFIHDDIHLIDFHWPQRLAAALERFDVVGLAGNRRRVPGQISWAFVDARGTWDARENLSGVIGHGDRFPCLVDHFGPPLQDCKLLDGLFLAVRKRTLLTHGLMFDDRFAFHLYDLDFCRQAESMGLTMGTADISVIHESFGSYSNNNWAAGCQTYLAKWGE